MCNSSLVIAEIAYPSVYVTKAGIRQELYRAIMINDNSYSFFNVGASFDKDVDSAYEGNFVNGEFTTREDALNAALMLAQK
jgi:hypothetical protein